MLINAPLSLTLNSLSIQDAFNAHALPQLALDKSSEIITTITNINLNPQLTICTATTDITEAMAIKDTSITVDTFQFITIISKDTVTHIIMFIMNTNHIMLPIRIITLTLLKITKLMRLLLLTKLNKTLLFTYMVTMDTTNLVHCQKDIQTSKQIMGYQSTNLINIIVTWTLLPLVTF